MMEELVGYQFLENLYEGSRTVIHRCLRMADQKPVVIKFLRHEYPSFNELVQFRNQYNISQQLNAPGIICTYSLETYGNAYGLVMEDFGGISLSQWLQDVQPNLIALLQVAIGLCDSLQVLYQNRIIHKDIKPANILIHPETQQVKLIDFSISSQLPRETQELLNPNTLEGTLAYLSPEQTGRMNRGIDYRSDFYSFGVTLYEMLTGQLPFPTDDPLELIHCHLASHPNPVHLINPAIPEALSNVVSKLMAKNAEDRYQSALGLKHDLVTCLHQLKESGTIAVFALGSQDLSDRFTIPEKLYGREAEVQTLLNAFERVTQGHAELMLVAGLSGIGKTAVINEVHKPIVRQRGYFIKGKFDQFNRNVPFSAFVQAFRELVTQLLSESDLQLQTWKTQILEALGDNAQVIVDLIPELERILGPQPPATELSGTAAQNRFNLLFQRFIRVFTTVEHPLVMFIDDLQWADSASLNLMQVLMAEAQTSHLLLLGAYRDNEVFPAHPLLLTLDGIAKAGATIETITLQPLSDQSLNRLVTETLHTVESIAQPLTELVMQKTQGNPFFATQFLKVLHQDQLITFDRDAGHWQCDIGQVRDAALTDDVVEFMVRQLQKLPESTQNILKLAACIGAQFDLETLAIVSEQSQTEVATVLWPALQEELILPQSEVYKFYLGAGDSQPQQSSQSLNYRFLHDRVQQAAYSLIALPQKQITHLKIGRLLLSNTPEELQETRIFNIVNQINIGLDLIDNPSEQLKLVQLNLIAGQKAKTATAYAVAINYFSTGIKLLGSDCWHDQYDLTLKLYEFLAESEYLNTNFEAAENLIQTAISNTQHSLEKVKFYEIKIQSYTAQNRLLEAITAGRQALELVGIDFPQDCDFETTLAHHETLKTLLGDRDIETLADLPSLVAPEQAAAMRILVGLFASIYLAQPNLLPLKIFTMVTICIRSGNLPQAAIAYSLYALFLCATGDIERGYQFGLLAITVLEKFQAKDLASKVNLLFGLFVKHWKTSIRSTLPIFLEGLTSGLEVGDLEYVGYCANCYAQFLFWTGDNLASVEAEGTKYYHLIQNIKQEASLIWASTWQQTVVNLRGDSNNPTKLIGTWFDESEMLPTLIESRNVNGICYVYLAKLLLAYLFDEHQNAQEYARKFEEYEQGAAGLLIVPLKNFYQSLSLLSSSVNIEPGSVTIDLDKVAENQRFMKAWAESAPMNYLHKVQLVEAEICRVLGKHYEAGDCYDRAIASANDNGFIQDEALANELAAKFYLNWGKDKVAAGYMQEAYYCYARWGAQAKVADLERRYPNLLHPILQATDPSAGLFNTLLTISPTNVTVHSHHRNSSSSSSINQTLDFAAILKASQALSSTIQLDKLLHQLTQIILQNSGSDRCALILPNPSGEWQVRAIATVNHTQLCTEDLTHHPLLPVKLIQYVKNTQELVVIDDLETDLPLTGDYLRQQHPQSVLCLPMLNQGHLIGILLLENQSTRGAFPPDRILILNFLCTQAAIALENARLYQQVQTALQDIQYQAAQFRSIFEAVGDGLSVIDLDTGMVLTANPAYHQMHGYSQDEILKVSPWEILDPQHHPKFASFLETVRDGKQFTCEAVCKQTNGTVFDIEIKSVPFWYNGKLCGLSVIRDVTDRKQMELAIQEKNRSLEQALTDLQQAQMQMIQSEKMSALGNLVAGVAHEINNPVGFLAGNINHALHYVQDIFGLLDLYAEKFPTVDEELAETIEEIDLDYVREDLPKLIQSMETGIDRIRNISTSLRTFSRADSDRPIPCNLHDGLDSTILILKHRLKANEHRPAIEIIKDYGEIPDIKCFAGQLNQVFMNILANAIDALDESNQGRSFEEIATDPNQIKLRTSIENKQVNITITDNGLGMPEEITTRIFDHLFTTKEVGKGTGLGLAIARQIVEEKHGGQLAVQSTLGEGTTFTMTLPINAE
ncbi:AAA family ATPase [Alkalinema pantanalense CENA528]|uniref:ATP-binding sensor histidine kinase n=1 Tax=Alkalinema pantanalense TaxID=1620705 RepID=UPI003D6E6A38